MQVIVYLLERLCGRELQGKQKHSGMDLSAIIELHRWGFPGVTKDEHWYKTGEGPIGLRSISRKTKQSQRHTFN